MLAGCQAVGMKWQHLFTSIPTRNVESAATSYQWYWSWNSVDLTSVEQVIEHMTFFQQSLQAQCGSTKSATECHMSGVSDPVTRQATGAIRLI